MMRLHSYALCALCSCVLLGCQPGIIGEYPGAYDDDGSPVDADVSSDPDAPISPPMPDAQPPVPDAPPPPVPCAEGDAHVVDPETGNCYMLFTALVDWEVALVQCMDIEAHLVDITSASENQIVFNLAGAPYTWMGGNDRVLEGSWVWLNGDSIGYVNWRTGEPNNSTSSDPVNGEDCMVLEGNQGGTWDDRPCTLRTYQFVCERE